MHGPSNIEITKEKLECLRPHGWLNDEVNTYTECLFSVEIKHIEGDVKWCFNISV
jgi:Ulp1 family protease